MRLRKAFLLFFFLLLLSALNASSLHAQTPECVQQTYESQLGVREATGRNDGEDVEKYLASVKLGRGYAWCAAFVNWVMMECGCPTPDAAAWSPSWFPVNRITTDPQPGDVFGIYFPDKKRIAHVGFINEWGNRVHTVEGNTNAAGSRDGNGVYRKIRLRTQIYKVARWIN